MTTQDIRNKKNKIRKVNKIMRAELDREVKGIYDDKICENIVTSVSFEYADTILMFYPTEHEVDILPIFNIAKEKGKRVAFPKSYDGRVMKFFYVEDMATMQKGRYGICEPQECEEFTDSVHPLVIVPCLAAARDGSRLGYGGSYYDRFLKDFSGVSMCVCYEMLLSNELPQERRYDKKVDIILTEKGVNVVG